MPWPELTLDSWAHFIEIAAQASGGTSAFKPAFLFRGQRNAKWGLLTTLQRSLPHGATAEQALVVERLAQQAFKEQARVLVDERQLPDAGDLFDWWALMQHHGAPTRLVDWTASPYVAAYFASEEDWDETGAIWVLRASTLTQSRGATIDADATAKLFLDPRAPNYVVPLWSTKKTERMISQQGEFTACTQVLADQEEVIDQLCASVQGDRGTSVYRKLLLPPELKPEFLRHLRAMNVTASSLFPGVDGLGRSVAQAARLEGWRNTEK